MSGQICWDVILAQHVRLFPGAKGYRICVYILRHPSAPCLHRKQMLSIGGYHCSSPNSATEYQLEHRSISSQVANRVDKNHVNLPVSPSIRYVSIESPL
ncbi:hypothetical protein TNCV_3976941 [Trichonephila clavipes]|nr:hypothetical protein TNCV_3976941 [Trichonephila clavipes]